MENKFLVKFQVTQQCSPDDYEVVWQEKMFNEATTLKEVEEWVLSKFYHANKKMVEVRLSKPEQSKP